MDQEFSLFDYYIHEEDECEYDENLNVTTIHVSETSNNLCAEASTGQPDDDERTHDFITPPTSDPCSPIEEQDERIESDSNTQPEISSSPQRPQNPPHLPHATDRDWELARVIIVAVFAFSVIGLFASRRMAL